MHKKREDDKDRELERLRTKLTVANIIPIVVTKNEEMQVLKAELDECKEKLGKEVTKLTVANINDIRDKDMELSQLRNQIQELQERDEERKNEEKIREQMHMILNRELELVRRKVVKLLQTKDEMTRALQGRGEGIAVLNANLAKAANTPAKLASETMKMSCELMTPNHPNQVFGESLAMKAPKSQTSEHISPHDQIFMVNYPNLQIPSHQNHVSTHPISMKVPKAQTKEPISFPEKNARTNRQDESTTRLMFHLNHPSTIAELRPFFASAGEIKDFYYPREKVDKNGLSFGFVKYFRPEDAANAIQTVDGMKVQDQTLVVSYPSKDSAPQVEPGTNVIFHLESPCAKAQLKPLFASVGGVRHFFYKTGSIHGFVTYFLPENALKAIQSLNGTKVNDQTLKVSYPSRLEDTIPKAMPDTRVMFHLDNPSTITELRPLFAAIGTVKMFHYNNHRFNSLGSSYGFVDYFRPEDAEKAILLLCRMKLQNNVLYVKRANRSTPNKL